jgi:protein-tyrosine phosphatase
VSAPAGSGSIAPLTELHCHLVPAVDDGARSVDEALSWLRAFRDDGITRVVTTPHLSASDARGRWRERIEERFAELADAAAAIEGLVLSLSYEIRIDEPEAELADPALGLGGGALLVEFPQLMLPAFPDRMLESVASQGWRPVLAHPERYTGIGGSYAWIPRLREAGVVMCVNAGSPWGEHGPEAERVSRRMLAEGHTDCFASDHHGREGRATSLREVHDRLARAGFPEAAGLLAAANPASILGGAPCEPVPPVDLASGLVRRLRRMVKGGDA